ncbi:MAG: FeoA family protein [Candidatus Omnitrophota bacterium]|jgi:ferrous iron transport protein A
MGLSIGQMKEKQKGRIKGFASCEPAYRKRLLAMGLMKETEFTVIRKAPLGDPIEIRIKDYNLSLRKDEADVILVETES